MGRVERRMYKRRRKRAQIRLTLLAVLLIVTGVLIARRAAPGGMQAKRVADPSPTPVTAAYDTRTDAREITLPADTWYAIQTGVFSTEEAARDKAGAYASRGAPGTVVQDGAKWRVFIACYGSEEEASAVRTRLGEMQRVETYLYAWACPELRLRLSGQAGQLDVAEAGLSLFLQTAARLRDTAILLDASQLTLPEAQQEIAAIDGQMTLWAETARSRFPKPHPALVEDLLTCAANWTARRKALDGAGDSATELSAALKAQGMAMYDEAIRVRGSIGTEK